MVQQQFQNAKAAPMSVSAKMTNAKDQLLVDTKDSVQLGLEVAAGQAALSVLRSFVVPAKVSLVDRCFGKGAMIKKVVNSPAGSFVLASSAHVAISVFAPNNVRLNQIAKLALNASIVELTARIPVQEWTDKLAAKLFDNAAIGKLFGDDKADAPKAD